MQYSFDLLEPKEVGKIQKVNVLLKKRELSSSLKDVLNPIVYRLSLLSSDLFHDHSKS